MINVNCLRQLVGIARPAVIPIICVNDKCC